MRFEDFKQELQNALTHLYDPDYHPAEIVYLGIGCDPNLGPNALQTAIVHEIESLEPEPEVPAGARLRLDFDVLYQRFVLKLAQEETACRIGMSVRSVQRVQREAIHLLARRLWDQSGHEAASVGARKPDEELSEPLGWHSQVWKELAWLHKSAVGTGASLRETIEGALRIVRASIEGQNIRLEAVHARPDIWVRSHPSVLRQILLGGILELVRAVCSGTIYVNSLGQGDRARITMVGCPVSTKRSIDVSLARELLSAQGGAIESRNSDDSILLIIDLPAIEQPVDKATVLVVDDNADMATVFAAYCTGTRYEIVSLQAGQRVPEAISAYLPDVILLDVIMPDIDGWDVLLEMQRKPAAESVPIIVCSVVTDEQLALDLGASLYLRKPVDRGQLISALDQVVNRAVADA